MIFYYYFILFRQYPKFDEDGIPKELGQVGKLSKQGKYISIFYLYKRLSNSLLNFSFYIVVFTKLFPIMLFQLVKVFNVFFI